MGRPCIAHLFEGFDGAMIKDETGSLLANRVQLA